MRILLAHHPRRGGSSGASLTPSTQTHQAPRELRSPSRRLAPPRRAAVCGGGAVVCGRRGGDAAEGGGELPFEEAICHNERPSPATSKICRARNRENKMVEGREVRIEFLTRSRFSTIYCTFHPFQRGDSGMLREDSSRASAATTSRCNGWNIVYTASSTMRSIDYALFTFN